MSTANLGFAIDSSGARTAAADLSKMVDASAKADAAAEKLGATSAKSSAAMAKITAGIDQANTLLAKLVQSSAQGNAALDKLTVSADKATDALAKIGAGGGGGNRLIPPMTDDIDKLRAALDRFSQSGDSVTRLQAKIAEGERLIAAAQGQGLAIPEGALASLTAYRGKLAEMTGAANDNAAAAKLSGNQIAELGHITRSVAGTMLYGGSAMQAFGYEANRIASVLTIGPNGVGGTLKAIGGLVLGLINPFVAAGAAFAATAGTAALAYKSLHDGQEELRKSLMGYGAATGVTANQLETLAEQAARTAHVSVGAARDIAAAFVATGKVQPGQIGDFTSLTKRYSDIFGGSTGDVATTLSAAFADPAKGADKLQDVIGHLSAQTLEYIRDLQASNRTQEAQKALFDAISGKLDQFTPKVGILARAWHGVEDAASGAWEAMGHAVDLAVNGRQGQDQVDFLKTQIEGAKALLQNPNWGGNREALQRALDENQKKLAEAQKQLQQEQSKTAKRAGEEAANSASQNAQSIIESVNPTIQALQDLKNKSAALRNDMMVPGAPGALPPEYQQAAKEAQDALNHGIDTFITTSERQRQENDLAIRSINARTVAEKAAIAAEQERLKNAGSGTLTSNADLEAQRAASARVFAEAQKQANDALRDANTTLGQSGLQGYALSLKQINDRIQEQIDLNPKAAATWRAIGDAERSALETQTRKSLVDPLEEQLRSLQAEAASVGLSDDAHRRLLATLDAETTLRRSGIDLNSTFAKGYERDVAALSDYSAAVDRATGAMDTLKQGGSQAIDDLVGGFTDGATSISDVFANVAKDIEKTFLQLAVTNPLKNMLLNTAAPTLSDLWSHPQAPTLTSTVAGAPGATPATALWVRAADGGVGGLLGAAGNHNALAGYAPGDVTRAPLPSLSSAASAIKSIESSGNYGAIGPLTASGDRAYGAYQVMGANIPSWTEQAVGYRMTPNQFIASPDAQDAVFQKIFGGYASKYGNMNDAASAWFTGRPLSQGANASDVLGTTGSAYVDKFNVALRGLTTTTGTATRGLDVMATGAIPQAADGLGNLGSGFNAFGKDLSNYFPPAPGGGTGAAGGGGIFGNLLGGISNFGSGIGAFLRFGGSMQAFGASFVPGMYASGTDYAPGGYAIVGEQGPELLNLPVGAKVVPNHRLVATLADNQNAGPGRAAANGNVTVNVHNNGEPTNADVRQSTDASGNRQIDIMLDKKVDDRVLRRSSSTNKQLRAMGLKTPVVTR